MRREHTISEALSAFFDRQATGPVDVAYLFGSEAAGRAHDESDVDVAVLLDRETLPEARERFEYRVRLTGELIAELHRNEVDVVVLNDAPPLLGRRIVTDGRRVFCRNRPADHAFVRDVRLRAADVAPFVERGRRRLLDRMVS